MIEEILPNLYRIEIPLPKNPLKALNSYVIKAPGRNLIIDTGMNREECARAMHSGLGELGVDLNATDFFITHLHADHSGLVAGLATAAATIYFSQPDGDHVRSGGHWEKSRDYGRANGFPEDELQEALDNHPGRKYSTKGELPLTIVKEGDEVSIGDYVFKCVETPGHTRGHLCLYEPGRKILISGDHLLSDITPNISLWSEEGNPLKDYLASLEKISRLEVALVLPGHRSIFRNFRERIRELQQHHALRAREILSILKGEGNLNAFQIASRMSWDMTYPSWDLFPASQKWFATGEAIAHLRYLLEEGVIKQEREGQIITYSLK